MPPFADVQVEKSDQLDMTLKWQNGLISNYDYLMYLNRLEYIFGPRSTDQGILV